MPSPTPSQLQAISAHGNVLVMAGAGTGKTRTLVERCLAQLLDVVAPCDLDEILIVTFTEAAAAEMKRRLRNRIEEEMARGPDGQRLGGQLALVDTAPIGTLHSICLRLIRDHFHQLGLDPQLSVLEESRAATLAAETLVGVLGEHYRGQTELDEAVRDLILVYGEGRDEPVRQLVERVYGYAQTLPDPVGWFEGLERLFRGDRPSEWESWLHTGFEAMREEWQPILAAVDHPILRDCAAVLAACPRPASRTNIATACAAIRSADDDANWKRVQGKTAFRRPNEQFFNDAEFLGSLAEKEGGADPLDEDWSRLRPHMATLVSLVREFGHGYAQAKRDLAVVDFHDLEQFALRLLWDATTNRPTALAQRYADRFRHVLVDEYQDINAAQDCLLRALSRLEPGNRFLVGDVKQSIYRFRLANPRIFQRYASQWRGGIAGQTVALRGNFRSHEAILDFVNALFGGCLRPEVGGVAYDDAARLDFGGRAERQFFARTSHDNAESRVELLLRLKPNEPAETQAESEEVTVPATNDTEQEAWIIARHLAELKSRPLLVWDEGAHSPRPVVWRDMVVLLRAPRNRAEAFAQVFQQAGIPLVSTRGGFYGATEVTDLLNLLTLLDNPLQDLPVLAVLRSPLAALTLDELTAVRIAQRHASLWLALLKFSREGSPAQVGVVKVTRFLERFARWRELARRGALSVCLETILDETHYEDWLVAQERGEQRRANVHRLLTLTRQFDLLQHQGLHRFLRFVAAQQEVEFDPEPATLDTGDAVRLMSIHQSKGLEFPVVVVAGLGVGFNRTDLHATVILDEELGLAPLLKVPSHSRFYPSLPHWLARRRQWHELLGEEGRLLYVATTRAAERLVLVGTVTRRRAQECWSLDRGQALLPAEISAARSCLDWIGLMLPSLTGRSDWLEVKRGQSVLLSWSILQDDGGFVAASAENGQMEFAPLTTSEPVEVAAGVEQQGQAGPAVGFHADQDVEEFVTRLDWSYPHLASTVESAKTSVTALRRRWAEETDDEAQSWFRVSSLRRSVSSGMTAAERGVAHHRFLQHVALGCVSTLEGIKSEAARLRDLGVLSPAEHAALDLSALVRFWKSELGRRVAADPTVVRRELEFTARFQPGELRELGTVPQVTATDSEFVVVQGVADLVVLGPDSLWLLDFKTDDLSGYVSTRKARDYQPQLTLYARALERIYRRPVVEAWLHFLSTGDSIEVLAGLPPVLQAASDC